MHSLKTQGQLNKMKAKSVNVHHRYFVLKEAGNGAPFLQNLSNSTLTFSVMNISILRNLFMKKMNQAESFHILHAAWKTI